MLSNANELTLFQDKQLLQGESYFRRSIFLRIDNFEYMSHKNVFYANFFSSLKAASVKKFKYLVIYNGCGSEEIANNSFVLNTPTSIFCTG